MVDELIVATGFRPDFNFLRELRIELDPAVESPVPLAPLIDPNLHSCGTVRPHGARELAQPEPGFYFAGMKSYGRAPTFLMLTGYEQVRSIAADIAGDRAAAERVELVLPETGVCSRAAAPKREPAAAADRRRLMSTPVAPTMQTPSNKERPVADAANASRSDRVRPSGCKDELYRRDVPGAAGKPAAACRGARATRGFPDSGVASVGRAGRAFAGSGAAGYMLAVPVLATLTDRIDARQDTDRRIGGERARHPAVRPLRHRGCGPARYATPSPASALQAPTCRG